MDIGFFVNASTVTIPDDVMTVRTAGFDRPGYGDAAYHVAQLTEANLQDNPRSTFKSANGRTFELTSGNILNAASFGVIADGHQINDTQWDGTDSTLALDECVRVAAARNMAIMLPSGMIVVASVTLRGNSVIIGQGKRQSIIYHKSDSADPLFSLIEPYSSGVRCQDFQCWGHYGAAEDCFRLWPKKTNTSGFAFLDAASFTRIYIQRFGGKSFWFAGGDSSFDEPCQFITIEDVQIDTPYINDGSRCLTATGQAAQIAFLGSNRFDGSSGFGSAEEMKGCNICVSGRYTRATAGVVEYGDAFDAGCHSNDGNPVNGWVQLGFGGCSGYFWGTWGGIQGALYGVYMQNTEMDLRAYFENVRRAVTVCNASAKITDCRANNGAADWLIKSIGTSSASRIWFGRNRIGGVQADALYQRGANGDRFLNLGNDSSGESTLTRTSGFSQDLATSTASLSVRQKTNYLHGPAAISSLSTNASPGDVISFLVLDERVTFNAGGNIALDTALSVAPGEIVHFVAFENVFRLLSLDRHASIPEPVLFAGMTTVSNSFGAGFTRVPIAVAQTDTNAGLQADGTWLVGATGAYEVTASIRWADGSTAGTGFALGAGTALADNPYTTQWFATHAASRQGASVSKVLQLSAGDRLQLFTYVDGSLSLNSATLTATMLI